MHEPDTILLSSLRLIITKIHAKYPSKRYTVAVKKWNGQTDRQTNFEKYYIDDPQFRFVYFWASISNEVRFDHGYEMSRS